MESTVGGARGCLTADLISSIINLLRAYQQSIHCREVCRESCPYDRALSCSCNRCECECTNPLLLDQSDRECHRNVRFGRHWNDQSGHIAGVEKRTTDSNDS